MAKHIAVMINHSVVMTKHSAVMTKHRAVMTKHSAFMTKHSAVITKHSTIMTEHSAVMTLDTQSPLMLDFLFVPVGLVLNEFIRHFEPAVYDRDALMTQHKRLRRDATSSSPPLSLHIKANSR
jgi:hypothetical protein